MGEVKLNPAEVGAEVRLPFGPLAWGLRRVSMEVMWRLEGILFVDPPDLRFFAPGWPAGFVGLAGRERLRGVAEAVLGWVRLLEEN